MVKCFSTLIFVFVCQVNCPIGICQLVISKPSQASFSLVVLGEAPSLSELLELSLSSSLYQHVYFMSVNNYLCSLLVILLSLVSNLGFLLVDSLLLSFSDHFLVSTSLLGLHFLVTTSLLSVHYHSHLASNWSTYTLSYKPF